MFIGSRTRNPRETLAATVTAQILHKEERLHATRRVRKDAIHHAPNPAYAPLQHQRLAPRGDGFDEPADLMKC
jgi:hypothetical protein